MIVERSIAVDEIKALVGDIWNQLSTILQNYILDQSQTLDAAGLRPGQGTYTPTVDVFWAAADAMETVATMAKNEKTLVRFSSEGASFEWQPDQAFSRAEFLRRKSLTWQALYSGTFTIVDAGAGSGYDPTSQGWPQ